MDNLTHCPFCHGTIKPHWKAVYIWKCNACDLLFRNPFPSEADLVNMYEVGWTDPQEHLAETGGTSSDLARIYSRKLANSLGRNDLNGLKICEFGAGRGAMLAALAYLGADVYAIEPFGSHFLRERGYKVFRTLDEIPKGLLFDGIVTIDVLEHLTTPWNELKRFMEICKTNSFVYIATPNVGGLNARIYGSRWREALNPSHLVLFTPRSLEQVLASCGYKRYRRLRWFIRYSRNPALLLLRYPLQASRLDGELRYLAWNS